MPFIVPSIFLTLSLVFGFIAYNDGPTMFYLVAILFASFSIFSIVIHLYTVYLEIKAIDEVNERNLRQLRTDLSRG